MKLGYARVSTRGQDASLEAQRQELARLGCDKIFDDVASGVRADRPGMARLLDQVRQGDTLVVTRLDRLGRSTVETVRMVRDLDARGVAVEARDVALDTDTPAGKLVVSVMAALAEWERDTLRERTREGLAHARANGRVGGRPRALNKEQQDAALAALRGGMSIAEVARFHGVSRQTITRLRDSVAGQ